MTLIVQSAIKEVRDQIMLDTADGEYLNNVGQNLGIQRPPFGFTDNTWRAIVKLLAVHYKQIKTKFEDILAILFGPKKTLSSVLTANLAIGDTVAFVKDTTHMPQVGTVVFDEGLANEETIIYSFIDRRTNKLTLETPVANAHTANLIYASKTVLRATSSSATSIIVSNADPFVSIALPFTLVVDQGNLNEEVATVTAVTPSTRTLTVNPLNKSHTGAMPTTVQSALAADYVRNTYLLPVEDSSKFPDEGCIIASAPYMFSAVSGTTTTASVPPGLSSPGQHVGRTIVFVGNNTPTLANDISVITANTGTVFTFSPALAVPPVSGDLFYIIEAFTATAGSTTTVTVGSPILTAGDQVGNQICFVGNITAALAGVTVDLIANTTTQLTFGNTVTSPVANDRFYIRPRVEYSRNSYIDSALVLRKNISSIGLPRGTLIELLDHNNTVSTGQVIVEGIDWDVIQSSPRDVEILLPGYLNTGDLRTASYIHTDIGLGQIAQLDSNAFVGDTVLTLDDISTFPMMGVIDVNTIHYGYYKATLTNTYVSSGSSSTLINVGSTLPSSISAVTILGINYPVTSNGATTITLSYPLKDNVLAQLVDGDLVSYISNVNLTTTKPLTADAFAFDPVSIYEVNYPSTRVSGNLWDYPDVFPGPYVYDNTVDIPVNLSNITTISTQLAGPVRVVVDQSSFNNTLEVDNAAFYPLTGYPYNIRLGATTGNLETTELTDVNLKQRTYTTIAAPNAIGDTYIQVTSLGAAGGSRFPNSKGYRVLVGRGTANEEVIYASLTNGVTVPPRILCSPLTKNHAATEKVELLADLLSVTGLGDVHAGAISFDDRTVRWPTSISSTRTSQAETVELLYTEIPLTYSGGFDQGSGTLIINYLNNYIYNLLNITTFVFAGSNSLQANSTAKLPIGNYPYPVVVGKGTFVEEVMFVTNNNVGTNTLTFSTAARFDHNVGAKVEYAPGVEERLTYSSIVGNSVRFLTPIVLRYNHYSGETVTSTKPFISVFDTTGYDFPLRMPVNPAFQLEYIIDLVRAAGIKVIVIYAR